MRDLYQKLPAVNPFNAIAILFNACIFLVLALSLKPHLHYANQQTNFNHTIPKEINSWREAPQLTPQVSIVSDEKSLVNQLYDDVLMRTYVNQTGQQIMVALAYAREQRQDVKVHQPDICYPAQGYQLLKSTNTVFNGLSSRAPVIGKQQLYLGQNHLEAVSYWIRVGDQTLTSGLQMRLKIIEDGLIHARLDDGILVRVSSVISDESKSSEAFASHEKFLKEFVSAVELTSPHLLVP